jgi:hypothetical protein
VKQPSTEPTPACFADDPEGFDAYRIDGGLRRACADCEMWYQREMEEFDRCHPADFATTPRGREAAGIGPEDEAEEPSAEGPMP